MLRMGLETWCLRMEGADDSTVPCLDGLKLVLIV